MTTSGGCQCGAVRYAFEGAVELPHLCHCRMCQKASGNYFLPLGGVRRSDLRFTRGEVAWFQSSEPVRRGFCHDCGTPLLFDTLGWPGINIVLGSLDDPAAVWPDQQFGTEARMPWFHELPGLPGRATEEDEEQDGASLDDIRATNRQHPDHDTRDWPPEGWPATARSR